MFISPRVYTCVASLTPGIWSGIPRRWCAYISLLSVYIYMRALHRVKRCLGADKRNPHRHGGAFIKGSMASVPPPQPPLGSTAGMTHLFIPGPRGRQWEEEGGQEWGGRGCMGRSCYTCQGGWLGQATGGFCSKSDRLTSPSPLHEADIELANLVCACTSVYVCL